MNADNVKKADRFTAARDRFQPRSHLCAVKNGLYETVYAVVELISLGILTM